MQDTSTQDQNTELKQTKQAQNTNTNIHDAMMHTFKSTRCKIIHTIYKNTRHVKHNTMRTRAYKGSLYNIQTTKDKHTKNINS